MTSIWRCGNHLDNPVTWRGTGCPDCETDRAEQRRARARRRALIRQLRAAKVLR